MYKQALLLPLILAAAGCVTPQTAAVEKEVCTSEPVEATGSRVESDTVCKPGE